ncbi:hypothetical protein D3C86_1930200 [compost metagenome]
MLILYRTITKFLAHQFHRFFGELIIAAREQEAIQNIGDQAFVLEHCSNAEYLLQFESRLQW